MDIDIRTLSLLVVIVNILQAIAIAFLYVTNRKYRGIGWWLLGSTLTALGFFSLLLRDVTQIVFISIILANLLIVSGSLFIYIGIMRFLDKRENLRLVIPAYVLFIVLYFYFTYGVSDISARTAIISVFLAYYMFLTAWALLGKVPPAITDSARFIAAVEFSLACFFVFRAVYSLLILPVESLFTPTAMQNAAFLFFLGGGLLLTIGLIIMVNERLKGDVTEAKDHFELIFDTSPDGILISRLDDGIIIDINKGLTDLTGFSRDDLIGSPILDTHFYKYPDDRQTILDEIREKGVCENFEIIFRRKDGSELIAILSARIITLQDVTCILKVARDITDRKRAEQALQQANSKLNLLSSITRHDILNSITAMRGYLDLARDEPADPKLKEYLNKLDESAKVIQSQIEFTREYQEIGVKESAWQNIGETVQDAAAEFDMKNVNLIIDCESAEIFADPLLRKVFYTFFDNAFRYAPPFTTISVSCTETDGGLSVVFADDGAGITEEDRKHLFERGFGKHTGLGLFLSREILAITGITITENGEAGKGARFEMTVPKGAYRFSGNGEEEM